MPFYMIYTGGRGKNSQLVSESVLFSLIDVVPESNTPHTHIHIHMKKKRKLDGRKKGR